MVLRNKVLSYFLGPPIIYSPEAVYLCGVRSIPSFVYLNNVPQYNGNFCKFLTYL